MTTSWLLIWNPRLFDIASLKAKLKTFAKRRSVKFSWSCSETKAIRKGDRVFLMRVGLEPRGLVGSGYALGAPWEAARWDDEKKRTNYVDVQWDWIDPEPLILRAELDQPGFAGVRWSPQRSGIQIKGQAADTLERAWTARRADRNAPVM